jgi:subtilisin family serine protease
MKSTFCVDQSFFHLPVRFFNSLGAPILIALALASPVRAQSDADTVSGAASSALPPSMQGQVQVMVEMKDAPAAVTWAAALKQAQVQADVKRNYALQHPTLKTSQALLKTKPQQVQISSASATQVQSVAQKNDQAQRAILSSLTGANIGGQVIYRTQISYNGIAMIVSPDKIAAIAALPGVKAVHPMNPKFLTAAFSDIDFLGTRPLWTKDGLAGNLGDGVVVADIDTGLDYIHSNFGGSGTYPVSSHTGTFSGTLKAPIGYDFAGDAYVGTNIPSPDPDPFDCNGHGTATASLIAGYGENADGSTYVLSYNATNPNMSTLRCSPGFAPHASLAALRVFGCSGSTNLVTEAIEWVMGYNMNSAVAGYPAGTHNPPFIHVINMSLGANEGFADDADDVAASNAASTGIIICSAAGNAGDSYYIHSSPAAAAGTLGVAATFNDQAGFIYDSNVTGNAPPAIAGSKFFSIKGSASSAIPGGGITGNLVYAVPPDANAPALTNGPFPPNTIVIINRGTTTFADKVTKGLNAGAAAVIIDNFNNPGADPILMSTAGQPAGVDVMISRTDRDTIVTAAGGNPANANGSNGATGFDAVTGVPTTPVNLTINNDSGVVSHGGAAPDTIPSYSSRGPRLPDSATKPDIAAPAEVVGVAQPFTGNGIENFNGTSSATPHVAGMMALLRELHPTWTVQELMALACDTATHDLFTTNAHTTQYGVGRIGAGRVDLTNAGNANVVAFNGTDPNLIGVSFGVVETPVDGTRTLTKNITIENKGATNVTYNTSVANDPALTGGVFTLSTANFTVNAGTSTTVGVTFTGTGNALKHARESSVAATQGSPRQWLTEAGGYAVFTPTDASPTLRVELYAAPKPASASHATTTGAVPTTASTGSFTINLSGSAVNTGASLGNGFDIVSLVKAFELQYQSSLVGQPNAPTDRNMIKFAGVTSDYKNRPVGASTATQTAGTNIMFGVEKFGDAATPDFASSDTEIDFDTNPADVGVTFNPNFAVFLTNAGTGSENVFVPEFVNLNTNAAGLRFFTNGLSAATADTNAYNNSGVIFPIRATDIGLLNASGTGNTQFQYVIVTFDRNGNFIDQSNILFYDLANPGLEVDNSGAAALAKVPSGAPPFIEPFFYQDLPSNSIPVNYNGANFQANGSLGVWLLHMHNGDGNRSDVVSFLAPTITGFSPSHAPVGAFVTLTGSNFGPGTQVFFQGSGFSSVPATFVNVITANTISTQVPAGAMGGFIRVQNAAGSSAIGGFSVP